MNDSGFSPVGYNVLVKPKTVEEKTAGGLYIPEKVKEKDEFARTDGVLVAVSPMAFVNPDWLADAPKPKVGDRVFFSRYQASEVKGRDGAPYWLMKDESIAGVYDD